jgi:hypothetical protein
LSHHKSFVEVPRVWKQAAERGGAVFEFMRRLTHVGSYIQAVLVVERLLIHAMGAPLNEIEDPLGQFEMIRDIRRDLSRLSEAIEQRTTTGILAGYDLGLGFRPTFRPQSFANPNFVG